MNQLQDQIDENIKLNRERIVIKHAFLDAHHRITTAKHLLYQLIHDDTVNPVVQLALQYIGEKLLVPSSTDLLVNNLRKGHIDDIDIITECQGKGN